MKNFFWTLFSLFLLIGVANADSVHTPITSVELSPRSASTLVVQTAAKPFFLHLSDKRRIQLAKSILENPENSYWTFETSPYTYDVLTDEVFFTRNSKLISLRQEMQRIERQGRSGIKHIFHSLGSYLKFSQPLDEERINDNQFKKIEAERTLEKPKQVLNEKPL
jgi:hypothetical protein